MTWQPGKRRLVVEYPVECTVPDGKPFDPVAHVRYAIREVHSEDAARSVVARKSLDGEGYMWSEATSPTKTSTKHSTPWPSGCERR